MQMGEGLTMYEKVTAMSQQGQMSFFLSLAQPSKPFSPVEDFTSIGATQTLRAANQVRTDEVGLVGCGAKDYGPDIIAKFSTIHQQTNIIATEAAGMFFRLSQTSDFFPDGLVKKALAPVLISRTSRLPN